MSKARKGDRRSAAAMVRTAEGMHARPSAADREARELPAESPPDAPTGDAEHAAGVAGAGGAAQPGERWRWDSLVSYPDAPAKRDARASADESAKAGGESNSDATNAPVADPQTGNVAQQGAPADDAV